jgi:type II secretory pathway component GspD/PulD (secretin)
MIRRTAAAPPSLLLLFLSILLLAPAAHAEANLDEKMTLYVNDADAGELLQSFARLTSSTLDLDPGWKSRKISLRVERVTVHDALNALCSAAGCRWQLDQDRLRVRLAPPPHAPGGLDAPIDLKVSKADLREVLTVAAQLLGVAADVDPSLGGVLVTLSVENEKVSAVLDSLCKDRCHWQLTGGDKPTLKVSL